jgi:heavy-metal exporter, HME family
LIALADTFRSRLAGVPGIADLQVERQVRIPQVQVSIDYDKAAQYGVTTASITEALEQLINGRVVSQVLDGARRIDLIMRARDSDRTTEGLRNVVIETPGGRIPLSLIATVDESDGPNQVLREGGRRRIVVMANSDGSDMATLVAAVRRVVAATPLPQGTFTSLEGTFQAEEQAARTIGLLSLVSVAAVFIVLYGRYRSAALTLIIMGNIPLALIGSLMAIWWTGQPLSVATMIGFITLSGIAARNGILKISHYINLVLFEGETFSERMIIRGSLERMTPVLLTALSAGLALVPLMVGAGEPGKELLHPVAIVIFGGLISATLLDAVLTPILFLKFGEKPLRRLIDTRREADAVSGSPSSAAVHAF